jgi:hypothetical protein
MRVGTENRPKVIAGVVLAALAVVFFVRMILLWGGPVTAANSTPPPAQRPVSPVGRARPLPPATASLDPTLRLGMLSASEGVEYTGTGRNIFRPYEPPPPPIPKPVNQQGQDSCVLMHPGCPGYVAPPPPINLKFFGFASNLGEPRRVFLAEGDSIFIAREGDIVNRRYKVLHIGQNSVEIEDVLNNNRQTIPLTQG